MNIMLTMLRFIKLRSAHLAASLLLLLAGASFAQSPPQPPKQASAPASTARQEPLSVEIKSMPERSEGEREEKAAERRDKALTDYWTIGLTLVLAVAAIASLALTRKLVSDAKDSSERQLRAYVNVNSISATWAAEPDDTPKKKITVELKYKNTGNTPARRVTTWLIVRNMPALGANFDPRGVDTLEGGSAGVQGPGQIDHTFLKFQAEIDGGVLHAWKENQQSLHVFGGIRYIDIFNKPRTTNFRFILHAVGVGAKGGTFSPCAEGNDYT